MEMKIWDTKVKQSLNCNLLIDQLNKQGYSTVSIPDYDTLLENFKVQFEAFNADKLDKPLTDKEWERILNLMLGKSVFQSAKILRDKFVLEREDGTKVYLSFFSNDHTGCMPDIGVAIGQCCLPDECFNSIHLIGTHNHKQLIRIVQNHIPRQHFDNVITGKEYY